MPAYEEDGVTRAPTIKPPKKPAKTKKVNIIGPTAPTVSPTRVSKAPIVGPKIAPKAQRIQAPTPTYTNTIFQQPKAPKIDTKIGENPTRPTGSNTVTDFIRGLRNVDRSDISGSGTVYTPEAEAVSGDDALRFLLDPNQSRTDGTPLDDQNENLSAFLSKIRPQNYDPEYGGVTMPEAWKHRKNDPRAPLKPHWDAQEIASNLSDFEPGSYQARDAMNDILYKQMMNQSNWVEEQTKERAYRVKKVLETAADKAFDGDFNYLDEKLEKNPDLLEFAAYKDEFTVGPNDIWNDWEKERGQYKDPWIKYAMRKRTDQTKSHYEFVRGYYNDARSIANRAIKRYEKSYNRSVEFALNNEGSKKAALAKEAGPAIPVRKNTDKTMLDEVAADAGSTSFAEFYGGDKAVREVHHEQRMEAAKRLGVKQLPSVKEMLAAVVAQGQIDPENDEELDAWVNRLQNPNHPDTRALYVAFARNENKKLDVKGDALDYINEPITDYMARETERAKGNAKAREREEEAKLAASVKEDDFLLSAGGLAGGSLAPVGNEDLRDTARETEVDTKKNNLAAIGWTFDKLMRLNYGVAGATQAWYDIDKNKSTDAKAWYQDKIPDPGGFLMGKNLDDSLNEIWNNPKELADPFKAGYEQVFRGSGFKGTSDDTVPITFSTVVANNAVWDEEDNIYDKEWYQHTAGLVLDIGTDPLNFVGVGLVSNTMKLPVSAAKSIIKTGEVARNAVSPARFLKELNAPNMSPAAEKVFRTQQALARQGDLARGDALITESGVAPYQFTVEYGKDLGPVGNASTAPSYTNQRFFADTKEQAAILTRQIGELAAQKNAYPGQVALASHQKELQKIVDDLDLNGIVRTPEVRVRTLMAQNQTKIRVEGVEGLNLNNPGGMFYERVLKPLEDATSKWPGHKSSTKFAEFTDEAGQTRLTQRAAAAKRALDEEETFYKTGSIAPDDVQARWNKAIDEAGDIDPNTGKPAMWQEYDIEHFLDEGAPGLFPQGSSWTPLKAYAKASGMSEEDFARFWTNEDIVRSLKRGPELARKGDPEYAARVEAALTKVRYSKEKLANTTNPTARANAYKALAMGYTELSQTTLEGSFRYLDGLRKGPDYKWWGSSGSGLDDKSFKKLIKQGGKLLEKEYSAVDDITPYIGGGDDGAAYFDGSYSGIDPSEFDTFQQMLDSVDSASFSSKSAQIQSLLDELEIQRGEITKGNESLNKVYHMSEAEVIELDQILPIKSQFRKQNGEFDTEAISRALDHNKKDIQNDNKDIFKVTYKLTKPAGGEDTVEFARYSSEARFLDTIAKKVEDNATKLFETKKTELVDTKTASKPLSEAAQTVEDDLSSFWTKGPEGRQGPAVRKLGSRPTDLSIRFDLEQQYPNTYTAERNRRAEGLNRSRNPGDEVDVHQETGTHKKVSWDASRGTGKNAAARRVEAIVKAKQRQWDKALKTAQETDAARYKELLSESRKYRSTDDDFKLTMGETQTIWKSSFKESVDNVVGEVQASKKLMASGANARLSVGDTAAAMHKQAADMIRYEELKLKIAKAEAETVEEIRAIDFKRKQLIKKKIALYDRTRKAKMEANSVRVTMQHRIAEEHLIQAATMPERMDARVLQLHIMGMKKNLQFTSGMFKGAEFAEKFVPARIWAAYQDNFIRPSKQLRTQEGIEMRARWESKTPVLVHARLQKLTKAMANTTESERSGMLLAYRKGIPYGGPKQLEYQRVVEQLEEIMTIINGSHEGYMFKPLGKAKAEALSLNEISRFLPEQYAFNHKVLERAGLENATRPKIKAKRQQVVRDEAQQEAWIDLRDIYEAQPSAFAFTGRQLDYLDDLGADANRVSNLADQSAISAYIDELKNGPKARATPDPFSPAPEARSDFTFDNLMTAIESTGTATPKDLIDPFRVVWVYSLAAEQASQLRALKKSIGETFGVLRPDSVQKAQMWNRLNTNHGWVGNSEIPNVYFPPEVAKEVDTLLKFTKPGPEQAKITKMMDQAIGYWKQGMTIYNLAYYIRNGIGEMMVSWLDGVNSPKWYAYSHRVSKYVKKTDQDLADLVSKYDVLEGKIPVDVAKGNEVLFSLRGGLKVRIEDVLKEYVDQGLKSTFVNTDLGQGVRGLANQSLESSKLKRGVQATNNKVHEVGEGFEDYLRMAHFMHAMEKSGKGSLREAAAYAATRVRRSHFDYTDFSDFEKTVMLRAFPFYKWIRRGAPLMMQHLFMTPGKMSVAPKAMDAMSGLGLDPINALPGQEGPVLDTSDVYEDKNGNLPNYSGIAPAWIRDLFSYQMQPAADDEYANFFRVSLPQFDGLQGILSLAEGNFGDSPINTLMNPMLKAPLELGMNKSLDPDNNFEIYGGEYNENMGISAPEAIGAYAARTANPWTSFLAKLSKNGKLPDGLNISDQESGRDATRDVASFLTGMGFYQSKLGYDGEVPEGPSAVGQLGLSDIPVLSGRAALNPDKKNDNAVKRLIESASGIESGESPTGDSAKTWTDFGNKKKSGWIPNKYGNSKSGRGYGGYGGGSSYSGGGTFALLELLRRLKDELDAGRVIDPDVFEDN